MTTDAHATHLILSFLNKIFDLLAMTIDSHATHLILSFSCKVFDWLAVTIDAHATHLILAKDAHDLLITLHQEVEQQVNFVFDLLKYFK